MSRPQSAGQRSALGQTAAILPAVLLGLLHVALLGACIAPGRVPPQDYPALIQAVLDRDIELGKQRDHGCESGPIHVAVERYVNGLDALDCSQTPPDFVDALGRHRDAWNALVDLLRPHAAMRGEMHALFAELTAADRPDGQPIQAGLDQVWATWAEVEAAQARYRDR